jgi:hypothetical protein
MPLAPDAALSADPIARPGRYQIGLLNLMALVVLAGATFGMVRYVRGSMPGPRAEETILVPTLLSLAFWLGVPLAEGVVDRLRRPTAQGAGMWGVAWRVVAILLLAALSADFTHRLGRYQRLEAFLAAKSLRPSALSLQAAMAHWSLWALEVGLAAMLLGCLNLSRSARPSRPAGPRRRRVVAGWCFLAILVASPFLTAWGIAWFRPFIFMDGLPGDDHWTLGGRLAPVAGFGLWAWLGSAEWLRNDLRWRPARGCLRSIAYRLATLGAVIGSAVVLAGTLAREPFDENSIFGRPLDRGSATFLALAAIGLAGGVVARASCPARNEYPRPTRWSLLARAAKGGVIVAVVVYVLWLVYHETWYDVETFLGRLWPSYARRRTLWHIHVLCRYLLPLDSHSLIWLTTIGFLAVPIVARLGPRCPRRAEGARSPLSTATYGAMVLLGAVAVLVVFMPYCIEIYRFDGSMWNGWPSPLKDWLSWLESETHEALVLADVELLFLAPGAYWLASRWYDSFAPPPAAPLDALLSDGAPARRFLADWAAASVLAVAALPIAYATFVLLLG